LGDSIKSLTEYTKIDVGWGFAPDPTRAYSWFQEGRFAAGGEWMGGREGLGVKGGEKGEVGE